MTFGRQRRGRDRAGSDKGGNARKRAGGVLFHGVFLDLIVLVRPSPRVGATGANGFRVSDRKGGRI